MPSGHQSQDPSASAPEPAPLEPSRDLARIFLVSLSLMTFEVTLVRIFSVMMWFHLAFFALAIALFGFGVGGLNAQLLRSRLADGPRLQRWMESLPFLLGLSLLVSLVLLWSQPVAGGGTGVPRFRVLLGVFLAGALPFFTGSLYLALLFARRPLEAGRLYFADLLGASSGCLLAVPVLSLLGGETAPCLVAVVAAAAGLVAEPAARWRGRLRFAVVLVGAAGVYQLITQQPFLAVRSVGPETAARAELTKWNFHSRITVETQPPHLPWYLNEAKYQGPRPELRYIAQDGRAGTLIVRFDGDLEKVRQLRYDIMSVPYRVQPASDLLLIGVGGGRDILTARLFGVPSIQGVELNPIIAGDVMQGAYRDFSGNIYGLDGVRVAVENGRTFIERDVKQYGLVNLSLVDTQSGSGRGAYLLSENHLYTVEAFEAYLRRLEPGGLCSVIGVMSPWTPDLEYRLLNTVVAALERQGVREPARHVLVFSSHGQDDWWAGHILMASVSPLTEQTLERARTARDELGFRLAWPPLEPDHPWTPGFAKILDPSQRAAFAASRAYDIEPLRDDRPYLFYTLRPARFFSLLARPFSLGSEDTGFSGWAFYLLIDVFFVALLCVGGLMFAPLLLFRRHELRGGRRPVYLFYFLALGVGYVVIEISVLAQCFLFLGDPTLAFAATLSLMLALSGLGSLWSRRLPDAGLGRSLGRAALLVLAAQAVFLLFLQPVLGVFQGSALPLRFAVIGAALALIAVPMGVLFPSGIRYLGLRGVNMTCWVWGMNGVGSVLGSVGSTLVSMNFGNRATFVGGMLCYLAAWRLSRRFEST